jgi:hypothetical protein
MNSFKTALENLDRETYVVTQFIPTKEASRKTGTDDTLATN